MSDLKADARCHWCGKPATTVREVAPAEVTRTTKQLRRPAVECEVCDEHAAMIDRAVHGRELEKTIARLKGRLARMHEKSPRRPVIVEELGRARSELAEVSARPPAPQPAPSKAQSSTAPTHP